MPAIHANRTAAAFAASLLSTSLLEAAVAQSPAPQPSQQTARAPTAPEPGYSPPRTSFGHPSFEGVWITNFVLPLEATDRVPTLTLPESAANQFAAAYAEGIAKAVEGGLDFEVSEIMRRVEGLPLVRGERRTRAVVDPPDGKIPYRPDAKKEAARGQPMGGFDNPEERPNWERCVRSLGQPPVFPIGESNPRHFIQTPEHVIVHTEYGSEARIVPLTDKHQPEMFWSLLGDAIARWEGDTLVIETVGLPEKDRVRLFPTFIVSSEATVTERYTRLSENELLYNFTVVDPSVYTAPWTGEFSLYRTEIPLFEHACHEGNYAMTNILLGERMKEQRASKPTTN